MQNAQIPIATANNPNINTALSGTSPGMPTMNTDMLSGTSPGMPTMNTDMLSGTSPGMPNINTSALSATSPGMSTMNTDMLSGTSPGMPNINTSALSATSPDMSSLFNNRMSPSELSLNLSTVNSSEISSLSPSRYVKTSFSNNSVLLIIVLAVLLYLSPAKKVVENFYSSLYYPYKYCKKCGTKSSRSCSKCTNCGTCVPYRGKPECVPGDSKGPYFRRDCAIWDYGSPKYYYPYLNKAKHWYNKGYWRYGNRPPYRRRNNSRRSDRSGPSRDFGSSKSGSPRRHRH
jgi:hypothetical protein